MLAKLPNEILKNIMFYCKMVDKCAIAQCSKHLNTIMEPFTWETIYITPNLLTQAWDDDSLFNKFRHARKMKINLHLPRSITTRRYSAYTKECCKRIQRNLANILDNIHSSRLTEAIIQIYAPTRKVSTENFIKIMEKLTSLKRLDLIGLEMTKKAWKSIPNELVHLGLIGHHSPWRATPSVILQIKP